LSAIISVGNKSDINETDLLEYLVHHDATKVIMIYIEGLKEGDRFIQALRRTTKEKPVVVVKAGRSQRGAMAAASHQAHWQAHEQSRHHESGEGGRTRATAASRRLRSFPISCVNIAAGLRFGACIRNRCLSEADSAIMVMFYPQFRSW
jgi:succinyl-CoA synthetase alpha subunit